VESPDLANTDLCTSEQIQNWNAHHRGTRHSTRFIGPSHVATRALTLIPFAAFGSFVATDTLVIPQGSYVNQPAITLLTANGHPVIFTASTGAVAQSNNIWTPGQTYVVWNTNPGTTTVTFTDPTITSIQIRTVRNNFADATFSVQVFDTFGVSQGSVSPGLLVYSGAPPQGAVWGVTSTSPIGSIVLSMAEADSFGVGDLAFVAATGTE
jgi:hypothetical protein